MTAWKRGVTLLTRVCFVLASTPEAEVAVEGQLYERRDEPRDGTGGLVGTVVVSLLSCSTFDSLTIATLFGDPDKLLSQGWRWRSQQAAEMNGSLLSSRYTKSTGRKSQT